MDERLEKPLQQLGIPSANKIFIAVLVGAVLLGSGAGYLLARNGQSSATSLVVPENPRSPQQDTKTFKDFAEGVIQKRPASKNPNEYVEGTHLLIRDQGTPVALTSSVVDLSLYEGKKVRVLGETQKAIKEGWLMDVGKVEVKN